MEPDTAEARVCWRPKWAWARAKNAPEKAWPWHPRRRHHRSRALGARSPASVDVCNLGASRLWNQQSPPQEPRAGVGSKGLPSVPDQVTLGVEEARRSRGARPGVESCVLIGLGISRRPFEPMFRHHVLSLLRLVSPVDSRHRSCLPLDALFSLGA